MLVQILRNRSHKFNILLFVNGFIQRGLIFRIISFNVREHAAVNFDLTRRKSQSVFQIIARGINIGLPNQIYHYSRIN